MLALLRCGRSVARRRFLSCSSIVDIHAVIGSGVRPHLDLKELRRQQETAKRNIELRRVEADVDRVLALEKKRQHLTLGRQRLEQRRNVLSKDPCSSADDRREKARLINQDLVELRALEQSTKRELLREALPIPNWIYPDVPEGCAQNARELRRILEPKSFPFQARDHVELGEALDWFDFDSASACSGPRFVHLKNEAVFLELALLSWSMAELAKRGFRATAPPSMVHPHVLERCGFSSRGSSSSVYRVQNSDLCLSRTSKVPLAGTLYDRIISAKELPLRLAGVSACFRTESGAEQALQGIYRQHQFNEVEMFIACDPEDSERLHLDLL